MGAGGYIMYLYWGLWIYILSICNKGRNPSNGYTIFGNKSYPSYIVSQISVHRKHEIIDQSGNLKTK